jgi:hypothetical protein
MTLYNVVVEIFIYLMLIFGISIPLTHLSNGIFGVGDIIMILSDMLLILSLYLLLRMQNKLPNKDNIKKWYYKKVYKLYRRAD